MDPQAIEYAKKRMELIEWLNSIIPNLSLSQNASDEELRDSWLDGTLVCGILNRLKPGSVMEYGGSDYSSESHSENVKRFLWAMDEMGLPKFQIVDLEKGYLKSVLECLLAVKAIFMQYDGDYSLPYSSPSYRSGSDNSMSGPQSPTYAAVLSGEERRKNTPISKFQRVLRSPVMAEPSTALLHHVGHKFHEVFQMKPGSYADLPAAKITEMMKSNSLDNAPTQSLLSVVNGIIDESVERKNGEIPHRVACLLRKVVQEIERRISTQAEHLRTQNNLFKAREEKYQSRLRIVEALAAGTSEETQITMNQLHQQIKSEKTKMEIEKKKSEETKMEIEKIKAEEKEAESLMKQKDQNNQEIAALKQELEKAKEKYEQHCLQIETEKKKFEEQDAERLMNEKDQKDQIAAATKQELESSKKAYEQHCLQMEMEAKRAQQEFEERVKEVELLLTESRNKNKELEANSESKFKQWNKKENSYQKFTELQLDRIRDLRFASQSIRQEMIKTQNTYLEEFNHLGMKTRALEQAAQNYYSVLSENRKLHNEVIELKGNIRVYCRIRPFHPGQKGKQSLVDYIGENGELSVVNPAKQGKEGRKSFRFNKVYGPDATQADVYSDTQPLIQSVLDGYNVCIFAYGQTGSGKTYTMTGPDGASEEDLGVNYRALNDLFQISQTRKSSFTYEVGVQMVEIYNEQVRDLLSSDAGQKRLGILTTSQPSGLAVPDASMHPVKLTSDVMDLMETGLRNRSKGATALNERSSRSHSVVTVHVRGSDLKTGASLRGSLHLVDLAGSERVAQSEVTGDRLKEAQHINKSLSALGDVIFSLSQKSSHVPYRNSKLTQVLQTSLGGQAKTLMFVQLNPDVGSFSESISTLKFAERVSGVELGAAKSSKDGIAARESMEQVTSLKEIISKKDEEIERLQQQLKDIKSMHNSPISEKRGTILKPATSSPSRTAGGTPLRSLRTSIPKTSRHSDQDNYSDNGDKHSAHSSQKSHSAGQLSADAETLSNSEAENEERLSDNSDGGLSMGTDTDGSLENNLSSQDIKSADNNEKRPKSIARIPRPPQRPLRDSTRTSIALKRSPSVSSVSSSKSSKGWK